MPSNHNAVRSTQSAVRLKESAPIHATCLHCHLDLGTNEAIDNFPTGRRLAFDQARGRLWVICTSCGRWRSAPTSSAASSSANSVDSGNSAGSRWAMGAPNASMSRARIAPVSRPSAMVAGLSPSPPTATRSSGRSIFDLIHPDNAEMAARQIMPMINASGGDEDEVRDAAQLHEQWKGRIGETVAAFAKFQGQPLGLMGDTHLSLAFEMSVYEEQEQRWMQTELYLLKSAWKEAEQIAAIADELTLPERVTERLGELRART